MLNKPKHRYTADRGHLGKRLSSHSGMRGRTPAKNGLVHFPLDRTHLMAKNGIFLNFYDR